MNGWVEHAGDEDGRGMLGRRGERGHDGRQSGLREHKRVEVGRKLRARQCRGNSRNSCYMPPMPIRLPTMGISFVRTSMNGGSLDPRKRRRTSREVEDGAKGTQIWLRLLERMPVKGDQAGSGAPSPGNAMVARATPK
jgi:hypothetical protein